jgi:hypothetical protein
MMLVSSTLGRRPLATSKRHEAALDRKLLVEEVAAIAECPESTAAILLNWVLAISKERPLIFRHFLAFPTRTEGVERIDLLHLHFVLKVSLPRVGTTEDNLFERWGHTLETVKPRLRAIGASIEALPPEQAAVLQDLELA